jgi:Ca2+-binding RTX toxin-like protein
MSQSPTSIFLPALTARSIALLAQTDANVQAALLNLQNTAIEGSSSALSSEPLEFWLKRAETVIAQYAATIYTSSSDLAQFYAQKGLTASTYTDHTTGDRYSDLSIISPSSQSNQVIFGKAGTDTVQGGSGSDMLFGGVGANTVIAGSGKTTLVSGGGGNTLVGGSGADTFYVQNGDSVKLGSMSNVLFIGPDAYELQKSYWDSSQQGFLTLDGTTLLTPQGNNSLLVSHRNSDGTTTSFILTGVSITSNGDGYAPTVTGPMAAIENITMQDIAAGSNLSVYSAAHAVIAPDGSISQPGANELTVNDGRFLRLTGINPADLVISTSTHQYAAPASGYSWEFGSGTTLSSTWVTLTDAKTGTSITFEDFGDPNNFSNIGGIVFGDGTEWSMNDLKNYVSQQPSTSSTASPIEVVGDSTLDFALSAPTTSPSTTYTVKGQNSTIDIGTLSGRDFVVNGYQASAYAANRLAFDSVSSQNAVFKQMGNDLLIIAEGGSSTVTIAGFFSAQNNPAYAQGIRFSDGSLLQYTAIVEKATQTVSIATSVNDLWQAATVTREASGRLSFGLAGLDTDITNLQANNPSGVPSILAQFFSQVGQLSGVADFPDFPLLREELLAMGGPVMAAVVSMGATTSLAPDSTGAYSYKSGNILSYLAGANGGTFVDSGTSATTDYLDGGQGNDVLSGGAGTNYLDGRGGSDVLTGGTGGANTYILGSGFGKQIIVNQRAADDSTSDIIQFANGIVQSMVSLARAGNDLLITLTGTTNQAIVRNYFATTGVTGQVHSIVFSDGTSLSPATVTAMNLPTVADPSQTVSAPSNDTGTTLQAWGQGSTLVAGSGNDTLLGAGGNDTLVAGTGNDYMKGGNGANTYQFGASFGTDVIDNAAATSAVDTIQLSNAAPGSVSLVQSGSDLVITVAGQSGSITYKGFFSSSSTTTGLQSLKFADGTTWSNADIRQHALPRAVYALGGSGPAFSEAYLSSYQLDVIQVAAGLKQGDLSFVPTANNTLQIVVKSTGQTVEIGNWFSDGSNPPVSVQFADGSTLSWAQINAMLPQSGAPGNVVIHSDGSAPLVAGSGNDVLFSSTGTEKIVGGPGQDVINITGGSHEIDIGAGATTVSLTGYPMAGQTVVYGDTSGNLIYNNPNGAGSGPNVLQLASDITPANVSLSLASSGPGSADIDLTLSTGQHITLQGALSEYATTTPALDKIQFGDGESWSWSDLLGKLQSHAGADGFAHLGAGQTAGVSDGTGTLVADGNNATLFSFAQKDYLFGGTGTDTLIADAGYDILQAGSGNSQLISQNSYYDPTTFSTKARASLLDGGSGHSNITLGGGIVLAEKGSSYMSLSGPTDVVLFNKGDGADYVSSNAQKLVLSMGNGIAASDISLSVSGYDLNLLVDGGEITLANYLAPWGSSHANDQLQVFTNAATAGDATHLQSETLNLADIVNAFKAAQAQNPGLTSWSLSNALGSLATTINTGEAYGGDVAAYYAMNGTLQNMSLSSAQATLVDQSFGALQQLHQNLSGGSRTLLG